jgi:hypothetical protein
VDNEFQAHQMELQLLVRQKPSHHSTPACARAPPLASSRPAPCLTQRTHAIGLWVAQRSMVPTILEEGSILRFGISERRGPAPHLRRLQAG